MSELVSRLRDYSPCNREHVVHEAAETIEALRARVAELERVLQRAAYHLSILEEIRSSENIASILSEISRLSGNKDPQRKDVGL